MVQRLRDAAQLLTSDARRLRRALDHTRPRSLSRASTTSPSTRSTPRRHRSSSSNSKGRTTSCRHKLSSSHITPRPPTRLITSTNRRRLRPCRASPTRVRPTRARTITGRYRFSRCRTTEDMNSRLAQPWLLSRVGVRPCLTRSLAGLWLWKPPGAAALVASAAKGRIHGEALLGVLPVVYHRKQLY